jgi:ATP-dependent Lon protease
LAAERIGRSAPTMTQIPESPFPFLPLRAGVLLPGATLALAVGRPRSLALVESLSPGDVIAVGSQKDPRKEEPSSTADLHSHATFAKIVQIGRVPGDRAVRLVVQGLSRLSIEALSDREQGWRAHGSPIADGEPSAAAAILADELRGLVAGAAKKGGVLDELRASDVTPGLLVDKVAAALDLDVDEAAQVLATVDVEARLRLVIGMLASHKQLAELRETIGEEVKRELGKNQREHLLREQLKAIKKQLSDDDEDDVEALRRKLDEAELPEEPRKVADRELRRLEQTGGQGAEANVIRTYLEWIAALPWSKRAETRDDVAAIGERLDRDHAGLDDVKKRILEHMAVRKLTGNERGAILCLVGPPGVGKTSLGQSIAEATNRPFVRISLGGVRDESEVRGHRRTYVGALPGRVVASLRKAGVKNPVVLLDEIDKLAQGWQGNPEAALLELLDPEQNATFTDHYLEMPFDLSEVLFLCTANTLDTLSRPLRDRLEIVEIAGYTQQEKLAIAKRHLVPKRTKETGLPDGTLSFTDDALLGIVGSYTREAGVRQLDREIGRLSRSVALDVAKAASDEAIAVLVGAEDLSRYLGKTKFRSEVAERTSAPGVATGLAWTPVGGDILFIETSRMKGKGRLQITGQLGDVMKESAHAALTYVRSHADELGVDAGTIEDSDLHIHVPAGAVPKDGPSAGVTMFTALASLLSGRCVRSDTAMTGECTLRGRVLPVGGIKAKVLAAHRAGIKRVILPRDNQADLDEVPAEVQGELEVIFAEDMREVLEAALEPVDLRAPAVGAQHAAAPSA